MRKKVKKFILKQLRRKYLFNFLCALKSASAKILVLKN